MLLDRGLLVEEGSAYRVVGEVESLEVPETLHALVAARLDGLSPDERRLVQDAAVLGKTFTPAALGTLTDLDRGTLEGLLSGLVRREVLTLQSDPRSPEQGQYGFLQDLLRHVAYETLPKRERRSKHRAAAELLSLAIGEEEVAEVVASHLLDAYRLDPDADDAPLLKKQARAALVRAGERAASLGASIEAQRYFEHVGELADEPAEQAAALDRAGQMASAAGDSEHAAALFGRAISLYETTANTHAAARASAQLAVAEQRMGHSEQAIARMEKSYSVISEDEPDEDLAFLLERLGRTHYFAGNLERAAHFNELALDLAEALELPEVLCRGWIAKAYLAAPRRREEARGLFQIALETALAHDLHEQAASACSNLSDHNLRRDHYADSVAYLEQALDLARTIGNRQSEWFALSEMTYALTMLGRWDEALARLADLPDEAIGTNTQVISPLTGVLELYLDRGQLDLA